MTALVLIVVYGLVAFIGFRKRDRAVDGVEVSLCLTCANSVVTRGTCDQEWVACNFGGAMRPVKFTVCQCTGFWVKSEAAKLVTIEGFVRNEREVYAEVAIS